MARIKVPIGKYERKPYMKTYGNALAKRHIVLRMVEEGKSTLEIARELDMDTSTVKRLKRTSLDWGNYSRNRKVAQ